MFKKYLFLLSFIFFHTVFPQLNGSYSIGSQLSDYETIAEAINDLQTQGVSGPVIFNIKDGIYQNETNTISEINGTNSINTITFQSENLDANNVTLNGTLYMYSKHIIISYLTFEKQTSSYNSGRNSILFNEDSEDIKIANCVFNNTSYVSNDYYLDYGSKIALSFIYLKGGTDIVISDNYFSLCGSAIAGYSSVNLSITKNLLDKKMVIPINLYRCRNTLIKGNEFKGDTTYRTISADQMYDELIIDANKIFSTNEDLIFPHYYSIDSKSAMDITSYNGGDLQITNNFISVKNGVYIFNFKNAFISNNSFNSTEGQCLILGEVNTLENIELYNNIFYTSDQEDQTLKISRDIDLNKFTSKNNVFQNEENTVEYAYDGYSEATIYNLSEWNSFSGKEEGSLVVENVFNSNSSDFHTPNNFMLNGKGISLDYVLHDIDEEIRDTVNPDIGADEFEIDPNTYIDLEILSIISPNNSLCENSNVVLAIKNNSLFPINSFDIESVINDFRGNFTSYDLSIMPDETIELPLINFEINKNTWYKKLEFFVSDPNELLDNNYSNNYKSINNVLQIDDNLKISVESNDCNSIHYLYIPNIYGLNLNWSTGETTNRIKVEEKGLYSVTITDDNGCETIRTITVN